MSRKNLSLMVALLALITACANPVAPTGGPVDRTPPELLPEGSTPNAQTNYVPTITELTFNEYIQLKNPARNVIISPPVKEKPDFKLRGKTLRIDWSEADTLRAETTYTLNFANAIEDLNEGNPVEDLVFAFSTGSFLDSLEWSIEVVGPEGSRQEGITVMLYEDQRDSVVRNELPYYFAITDQQGVANFQYLRAGTYKLFALKDDNLNLSYDLDNELIAFSDRPLDLPSDSNTISQLRLFLPEPNYQLAAPPSTSGMKSSFVLNPLDPYANIYALEPERFVTSEWISDSLRFWWAEVGPDSTAFIWEKEDTSLTYKLAAPDTLANVPLGSINASLQFKGREASLMWKTPMNKPSDTSFFQKDSTGKSCYFTIKEHHPLTTTLSLPQKECSGAMKINSLPGSLTNAYGQSNADTMSWSFSVLKEDDLAAIQLLFTKGDSTKAYIVRLWKKDQLIFEDYLEGKSTYDRTLEYLDPGTYSVEIVEDRNFNGHQDGGNYWKGRQPEWGRTIPLDQLRANWILDEEIPLENESTSGAAG